MALWTLAEQQVIKPLSNTKLFDQLQKEVETNDLVKYLGFELYQSIKRTPADYVLLFSGGSYTDDDDGLVYLFDGLKTVCAYLLYARYVEQSYIQDTFSGMVQHTGEGFQRISAAEMNNRANAFREVAKTAWDGCMKYLDTLDLDIEMAEDTYLKLDWPII